MKQFDKKDVFSWANAENARQYVGKSGYFADECFEDLENWKYGKLTQIHPDHEVTEIFECYETYYPFGLFIPADKVKEIKEEKTYRPFLTINEFLKYFELGDTVHLRRCIDSAEITGIFTSYYVFPKYNEVAIGISHFSFDLETMNDFQIEVNGKWQPFGVLEND